MTKTLPVAMTEAVGVTANVSRKPVAYDLDDPREVLRLYRECAGYLHTCRRDHHGTDREGREFAMDALAALAKRTATARADLVKALQDIRQIFVERSVVLTSLDSPSESDNDELTEVEATIIMIDAAVARSKAKGGE